MKRVYHISDDITLIKGKLTPRQVKGAVDILKNNEKQISPFFCYMYSSSTTLKERMEGYFKDNQQKDNQTHTYLICSKKAKKIIGAFTIGFRCATAEIYYWLDKSQAGNGIMSKTLAYMRDRLFLEEKIGYCYAFADEKNAPSIAILKKCGFCFEKAPDDTTFYCSMTREQYKCFMFQQKLDQFRLDEGR